MTADLLGRVEAALADPTTATAALDVLNQEAGRDPCHRRERILYQLQRFLTQNATPMAAPSTTHKFKRDFTHAQANIEVNGATKAVTAHNLTDEDVPLLKQYGYGHLLEERPQPEATDAPDLHKLKKPELQAEYEKAVGSKPDESLTKEELIKAIEAAPAN